MYDTISLCDLSVSPLVWVIAQEVMCRPYFIKMFNYFFKEALIHNNNVSKDNVEEFDSQPQLTTFFCFYSQCFQSVVLGHARQLISVEKL